MLPLFRNIHHSADIFSNPGKFDPSRFEVIIICLIVCSTVFNVLEYDVIFNMIWLLI